MTDENKDQQKGIWEKIFRDTLFEGGKVPNKEERKVLYDRCYRRCQRQYKKQYGRNPEKNEIEENIESCLRGELYRFQLETEKKPQTTEFNPERRNREREAREFAEDVRSLNRINRDFWDSGEDREEERKKENKKLKEWIEDKVRGESGYC